MSSQSTNVIQTTKTTGNLGANLSVPTNPGLEELEYKRFVERQKVEAERANQAHKTTPSDPYMGKDLNETDKPLWERPGRAKAVRFQEAEAQKATTSNKASTASKS